MYIYIHMYIYIYMYAYIFCVYGELMNWFELMIYFKLVRIDELMMAKKRDAPATAAKTAKRCCVALLLNSS